MTPAKVAEMDTALAQTVGRTVSGYTLVPGDWLRATTLRLRFTDGTALSLTIP